MTSQLVIRIDGYPDEVVIPALSIGVSIETQVVEAIVSTTRLTADVEVQQIPGEISGD